MTLPCPSFATAKQVKKIQVLKLCTYNGVCSNLVVSVLIPLEALFIGVNVQGRVFSKWDLHPFEFLLKNLNKLDKIDK